MIESAAIQRGRKRTKNTYMLTGKIVCGNCGQAMVGESGTSKSGETYHYYKCHGQKVKRNDCSKRPIPKEWLEQFVAQTAISYLTDEHIDTIAKAASDLLLKEQDNSARIAALQSERNAIKKRANALFEMVETGQTPGSLVIDRINQMEEQLRFIEAEIEEESRVKPVWSADQIAFWLHSLCESDVQDAKWQQRIIDALVNKVFVYDLPSDPDGRPRHRFVLIFNTSSDTEVKVECSDVAHYAPPQNAYPNTFYLKRGLVFGCVVDREVAR